MDHPSETSGELRLLLRVVPGDGATDEEVASGVLADLRGRGAQTAEVVASLPFDPSGDQVQAVALAVLSVFPQAGADKDSNVMAVNAVSSVLSSLLAYPLTRADDAEVGEEVLETVLDSVRGKAHEAARRVGEMHELENFVPTGRGN